MNFKRKIINNVLSVVFFLTFVEMFVLAGSLEQCTISDKKSLISFAINFTVMAFSGFKSGLLTVPDYRKGKNVR